MGLFDGLRLASSLSTFEAIPDTVPDLLTAADTAYTQNQWWTVEDAFVSRQQAMSVPAVARARNLMCGIVGMLPTERYSAMTGRHLSATPMQYQPDPASPRAVTYAWIADSILFYGVAYVQVLETYADDGRPSRFRWVDPNRVTPQLNADATMVTGYAIDGAAVPTSGPGSIIAIPGIDEGLLTRGARTILTAISLERAAKNAADEPTPQTVLQSTGVDLPAAKVTELLAKWKQYRRDKATAYLYSGISMEAVGFDPKSQQLVEARQYTAAEIARMCNLPAWYVNAETASMTYSNVEQERRSLIDLSVLPMLLRPIEDRLSMPDVSPRSVEIRFSLDAFLRGSAAERLDVTLKMLDAGLITLDEAKAREDLSPEGGTL